MAKSSHGCRLQLQRRDEILGRFRVQTLQLHCTVSIQAKKSRLVLKSRLVVAAKDGTIKLLESFGLVLLL